VIIIQIFVSNPLKLGDRRAIKCFSQHGNCDVRCLSPG